MRKVKELIEIPLIHTYCHFPCYDSQNKFYSLLTLGKYSKLSKEKEIEFKLLFIPKVKINGKKFVEQGDFLSMFGLYVWILSYPLSADPKIYIQRHS